MSDTGPDSSLRNGHRDRLRQKFIDGELAKYETLELLLSYAIPRRDVRPLARMLFKKFGGLFPILSASVEDLCAVRGMGRNTAIFLKAIRKVMLDGYREEFTGQMIFQNKEHFANFCKLEIGKNPVEEMHVLYLSDMECLLEDQVHGVGTYDSSAVYGVEIAKHALMLNAKYIVLVHNHPRPQTSFSEQDVAITAELRTQFNAVGIKLLDHFVVSGGCLYSMKDLFLTQFDEML